MTRKAPAFRIAIITSWLLIALSSSSVEAFLTQQLAPSFLRERSVASLGRHYLTTMNGYRVRRSFDRGDEDDFDLEAARERLESLLDEPKAKSEKEAAAAPGRPKNVFSWVTRPSLSSSSTYIPPPKLQHSPPLNEIELPPGPPLTTIERERREAEIQLLSKLADGDEVVGDLWSLWFGERGPEAAMKLMEAEELTGEGPDCWEEAEDLLLKLIDEYGVHWAEPVNRLATLYYMQGKMKESEILCQMVLLVKPWHHGALSGIVMVYAAMANTEKARQWATSRLPTFAPIAGSNLRRIVWVDHAVAAAKESLQLAEDRVKNLLGKPDKHYLQETLRDPNHDAWQ